MITCQKCGASVSEEQAFCQNCGSPMDAGKAAPTRQDASRDMAATVVGQKIPPMSTPPAKPAGNVSSPSSSAASPAPPAAPRPAAAAPQASSLPAPAASNRTGIYIGAAVLGGLLLVILLFVLLR